MSEENQKSITLAASIKQLQESVENTVKFFGDIDEKDLPGLLRAYKLLHENCEMLKSISGVLTALHEQISHDKLPKLFEENGIDAMKLAGRNFILSGRMFASIDTFKQEQAFNWLREHGFETLIKETVNAQSLSSTLKELLETEAITPSEEDGIKIYTKQYVSIRKT